MAKVIYEGPPNLVCNELEPFNQDSEYPAVPVDGETYEIPDSAVESFVASAYFSPADSEAEEAYKSLVERGIVVLPDDELAEVAPDAVPEEKLVDATDNAVELAKDLGIDLAEVEGSGDNGRISKADVQKYADENPEEKEEAPVATDPSTGEPRTPGSDDGGAA